MASICCSPPDSVPPDCPSRSRSRGKRSYTFSSRHSPERAPSRRFSRTERGAKMRRPCGTRARPRRAIRYAGQRSTAWPSNTTRPSRGGVIPDTLRISVVLPAPFRPRSATASPGPTLTETPCST